MSLSEYLCARELLQIAMDGAAYEVSRRKEQTNARTSAGLREQVEALLTRQAICECTLRKSLFAILKRSLDSHANSASCLQTRAYSPEPDNRHPTPPCPCSRRTHPSGELPLLPSGSGLLSSLFVASALSICSRAYVNSEISTAVAWR
jgi:hypothetical protein